MVNKNSLKVIMLEQKERGVATSIRQTRKNSKNIVTLRERNIGFMVTQK